MNPYSRSSKIVLLGDYSVGKSWIMERMIFEREPLRLRRGPIGCHFHDKTVELWSGESVRLQWSEPHGQEAFSNDFGAGFYRGTEICVLAYDVTQPSTLGSIAFWKAEVEKVQGDRVRCILIGTKLDIRQGMESSFSWNPSARQFTDEEISTMAQNRLHHPRGTVANGGSSVCTYVSRDDGLAMARALGISDFLEVSSVTNENMERLYELCARRAARCPDHPSQEFRPGSVRLPSFKTEPREMMCV